VAVEISSFTLVVRGIDLEDEPDILGVHTIGLEEPDILGVLHSDSGWWFFFHLLSWTNCSISDTTTDSLVRISFLTGDKDLAGFYKWNVRSTRALEWQKDAKMADHILLVAVHRKK
jgi:hypothetical protein